MCRRFKNARTRRNSNNATPIQYNNRQNAAPPQNNGVMAMTMITT